ncbi:hypothetical protein [Pseudomonas guineae]|uniref:hypothetical protein n=1 Tax=Pseudomonas guineae TaxID=425504 RepID=UPI0030EE1D12
MQPFKTLLAALMLGGSAAALAAATSFSSSAVATAEPAPRYSQSWPAIREVEHAWPQWMRNLQGSVLALHESAIKPSINGSCAQQHCADLAVQAMPASPNAGIYQHATDLAYDSPHIQRGSLQWRDKQPMLTPPRLSF